MARKDRLSYDDYGVITALQALEDLVVTVEVDQSDLESIGAAIRAVEAAIDARMAAYRGHDLIESAIADLKAECRAGLLDQADDENTPATEYRFAPKSRTLH